jgi:hypothetical protein
MWARGIALLMLTESLSTENTQYEWQKKIRDDSERKQKTMGSGDSEQHVHSASLEMQVCDGGSLL